MGEGDQLLASITVRKFMGADGVIIAINSADESGGELPAFDAVGMLEFAKDSLLHRHCCDPEAD